MLTGGTVIHTVEEIRHFCRFHINIVPLSHSIVHLVPKALSDGYENKFTCNNVYCIYHS